MCGSQRQGAASCWPGSCAAAACQLLVCIGRRHLPSTSTRQGAIASALEPASVRTPLTSVSTHSPTPPASHHLLTVVISCKLLQVLGDHCGTGIIGVGTVILDRRVHVLVLPVCTRFDAARACRSVKKNRASFACNQRKCEQKSKIFSGAARRRVPREKSAFFQWSRAIFRHRHFFAKKTGRELFQDKHV